MQHGKQLADALVPGEDPMLPQAYNYDYTFRFIEEKLKGADLAVANMEFPLIAAIPFSPLRSQSCGKPRRAA